MRPPSQQTYRHGHSAVGPPELLTSAGCGAAPRQVCYLPGLRRAPPRLAAAAARQAEPQAAGCVRACLPQGVRLSDQRRNRKCRYVVSRQDDRAANAQCGDVHRVEEGTRRKGRGGRTRKKALTSSAELVALGVSLSEQTELDEVQRFVMLKELQRIEKRRRFLFIQDIASLLSSDTEAVQEHHKSLVDEGYADNEFMRITLREMIGRRKG